MRKITRDACNAFIAARDWASGNTTVIAEPDRVRMYLHGNCIAESVPGCDDESRIVRITLAGWPTPTTRERVNGLLDALGLGARVYQRKHAQFIGPPERELNAYEWHVVM